ncbi:hypothetical protein [Archangium sp.]|jgi:hypothetical protein|uniref:hypothetical protein n=1 Tax=Archangium sp. TaxID=1872627 RepID=UPI002ED82C5A
MRGVRQAWCGIAALWLVSACAHDVRARPEQTAQAALDEELYAAAVRGTLEHFGRDDKELTLYCVVVPDGVPSERILARFENDPFLVAGPESCKWRDGGVEPASSRLDEVSNGQRTGVRVTPARAMFLNVERVRLKSPDRAEADTSIVYSNLGANGVTLKLERKDGQWKVVEAEDTWIS